MKAIPLGVRGSTAAPGAEFIRYGGHTSCVALVGETQEVPHLILDAGTGLRSLPDLLGDRPFHGDIVLTHLHWDHVQGLTF
jgi:phosphoribosyl 1,2-cyclic phosphodiesterase